MLRSSSLNGAERHVIEIPEALDLRLVQLVGMVAIRNGESAESVIRSVELSILARGIKALEYDLMTRNDA